MKKIFKILNNFHNQPDEFILLERDLLFLNFYYIFLEANIWKFTHFVFFEIEIEI